MLLNVVLIAGVAIIGLTHLRGQETPDRAVATDPTAGPASTLPDPERRADPGADVGADAAGHPRPARAPDRGTRHAAPATDVPPTNGGVVEAPRIKPTMRSNFAKGDSWPVGAGFRETGQLPGRSGSSTG